MRSTLTLLVLFTACGGGDGTRSDGGGPTVVATGHVVRAMPGARFEELEPLDGARVCLHGAADRCATTDADGAYRLERIPANAEVALAIEREAHQGALLPLVTDERPAVADVALEPAETIETRNAAAGATPDATLGSLGFVAVDDSALSGVSASFDPPAGAGPFYIDADRVVDPGLDATSARGFGFALDLRPGEANVHFSHSERACDAALLGWPGSEPGVVRAPVAAGLETAVVVRCTPR